MGPPDSWGCQGPEEMAGVETKVQGTMQEQLGMVNRVGNRLCFATVLTG